MMEERRAMAFSRKDAATEYVLKTTGMEILAIFSLSVGCLACPQNQPIAHAHTHRTDHYCIDSYNYTRKENGFLHPKLCLSCIGSSLLLGLSEHARRWEYRSYLVKGGAACCAPCGRVAEPLLTARVLFRKIGAAKLVFAT